ncbi:hypothetical protein GCM10010260_45840 [Streptomyces filipinensis]|uniref:Uncharacterized protein n=1 Tax=Streptomyces filipinensis TaxID=66887 RepID=A0A918MD31_9ACTN|nr:hypothetical protein GCM10010260_45840 [Streptomyces filipinensis]
MVSEPPTVAAGVEELPSIPRLYLRTPHTLDDLNTVTVGCWGTAVQINDPAFAENGTTGYSLDNAFEYQAQAHPEVRVLAVCEQDEMDEVWRPED